MTVQRFFEQFGGEDQENVILRIKVRILRLCENTSIHLSVLQDWPAKADFSDEFPDLVEDLTNALLVPNYTRRDGILYVASHFANNAVAPELGESSFLSSGVRVSYVSSQARNVQCLCGYISRLVLALLTCVLGFVRRSRGSRFYSPAHGHGGCSQHYDVFQRLCRQFDRSRCLGYIPCV
jgi:hypothetical protein